MKTLLILLIALILSGCVSQQTFTERYQKKESLERTLRARNQAIPKF